MVLRTASALPEAIGKRMGWLGLWLLVALQRGWAGGWQRFNPVRSLRLPLWLSVQSTFGLALTYKTNYKLILFLYKLFVNWFCFRDLTLYKLILFIACASTSRPCAALPENPRPAWASSALHFLLAPGSE